ncbi:MAG: serine hydrolase [Proteobacteria bacterium]|nr:serine hydrolase [Pseudomonadota bacterium]
MRIVFRSIVTSCAAAILGIIAAAPVSAQSLHGSSAARLDRTDLEAWLDGVVPFALQEDDIAGLAVSVVKDGEVLLAKGYGYADIDKRIPIDPARTVMRAASLSKTFTATAVMQLVEQGKLDLNRNVNDYLDFKIPDTFAQPITLRNLLTHTAGFEETAYRRYSPPLTLRQHVLMIPERIYPPGEITAYSNYGLNLAGYIVARVSGEPISTYIERHVLQPLGMAHSAFEMIIPPALRPFTAKNYGLASSDEILSWTPVLEMMPTEAPAGALATTADDMTRFMLANLQQGRYGDFQLLRPQTVQLMQAPAFVPIPGAQPVSLGLFRYDYQGHRIIGHSGDGEGAHSDMRLLPDERVGVFIALNGDGASQGLFPAALNLRSKLFERFVDRYFPRPAAPQEPAADTAKQHAQLAAGEYIWSRQQKGDYQEALALIIRFLVLKPNIRANPDGTIETPAFLTFQQNGRSQRWREIGPFVWREVGGDAHLVMKVVQGQVRSVWSDQSASFWVDLRVPLLWSARFNVPLLGLAAGVLLLTVLSWSFAAVARQCGRQEPRLADQPGRAYRLGRLAALLGTVYVLAWGVALVADFPSTVGVAPWIRLFQLIGLLCVIGAGVAVWSAWLSCRARRSLWAKAWSVMVALALLYLAWFSFAFHLLSVHLQ